MKFIGVNYIMPNIVKTLLGHLKLRSTSSGKRDHMDGRNHQVFEGEGSHVLVKMVVFFVVEFSVRVVFTICK